MPGEAQVFRLPMSGPDDVSGIVSLIADGSLDPAQIIAILGKTEGNGCVNDFTRGYATQSLRAMLATYLGEAEIAAAAVPIDSPHLEDTVERNIEKAAAKGVFGGAMMWGMLAFAVVILVLIALT